MIVHNYKMFHSLNFAIIKYFKWLYIINTSEERLKWHQMLWQMRESMLRQMLHVRLASDTLKI